MHAIQNFYEETGEYFSKTRSKSYGKSKNWPEIQEYLNVLIPEQKVLDVGCGDGRLLSGLPTKIGYTGIDFSHTLLKQAKNNYPQKEFVYGDITRDETWDKLGKFDAVVTIAVLHHIPTRREQIKILQKMQEHTKTGGWMLVTTWNVLTKAKPGNLVEIPFNRKKGRWIMAMDQEYLHDIMKKVGWKVENLTMGKNLIGIARNRQTS